LILAGMRGFHADAIDRLIVELKCADRVRITGWIPRDDLMQLYATARAFIYPSTFEGFGMPVLEAMAAGIPVACSAIAPLKEVAGDTALFFDPLDQAAISDAIDRIMSGQATSGRERAREFTWSRAAHLTLDAMK
jgi:glycosyltransferase involved in cell wall biosynthesis